jgi:hypothetical protein
LTATLRVRSVISRAAAMLAAHAAESSAAAAMPGSTLQSIGLLGCRQRPPNERLGALRAAPLSRTRLSRTSRSSSQVMAQARTRFAQS